MKKQLECLYVLADKFLFSEPQSAQRQIQENLRDGVRQTRIILFVIFPKHWPMILPMYSLAYIVAFRKACLAAVCLAFIANLIALFTLIIWILNVAHASTAKILKVVTMCLLAIAGNIYPGITEFYFIN